jgi:hypothetical protein
LSFGFVPLLQTLTISNTALSWHKMLKLSKFLGQVTLKELHLNFESEKVSECYGLDDNVVLLGHLIVRCL